MVFQTDLFLFQTPLDPQYSNVFDDYQSNDNYFVFLEQAFPHIHILLPSGMFSRKNKGDRFELVIQHYDSVDLENYNYLTFKDQNGLRRYAFITEIESLNDDQTYSQSMEWKTTCSCKLYCELDVWANNYLTIKDNYNSINERRCTLDTAIYRNYPCVAKNQTYSEHVEYAGLLPVGITSIGDEKNVAVPVWGRIVVKDAGYVSYRVYDIDHTTYTDYDSQYGATTLSYNQNGYITIYFLAGIAALTRNGLEINKNTRYYCDFYSRVSGAESIQPITGRGFRFPYIKSSEVISATLTTNVPFFYTFSFSSINDRYEISIEQKYQFVWGNKLVSKSIEVANDSLVKFLVLDYIDYSDPNAQPTPIIKWTGFETSPIISYVSNRRYATQYTGQNEQILNEYPFNYKSVNYNGLDIPIIGPMGLNNLVYLKYSCDRRMYAYIEFNGANDETKFISLQTQDEMPVQELELEEYLQRNSGALMAQGLTALVGSGMRMAGGDIIGGAMSIGNSALQIGTSLYDKANAPTKIRQTGGNSAEIPIPKDCCIIKQHTAYSPEKVIEDYHDNGYECFYIGSIFEKRRDCFDIDTGELTLTAAISDGERKKLKEAFARGVCRWHIGDAYLSGKQARRNVIKALNRKVFNYPISLIP